ncbi:MAG: hypothetical protein Hyperionvirus21_15 [Hyperionvirus sp.]|uniref:Uncharacterized protein n=1 Tax=Hyperionvirus sp. TaxID=2487770 RepID=A0A3G5ADD5_9VIRU|nr:MAG: hypothetical protein Hyperionvirus21_15 [Hyperionvirus sp.]
MVEYYGIERHVWAQATGGIFAFLAIIISLKSIQCHIKYNSRPILRKYILFVLGMVPVYAFISFFALLNKNYTYGFDIAREIYEAFVIYSFYIFLLAYISNGKDHNEYLATLDRSEINIKHVFPVNYILKQWLTGSRFLINTMIGTLQYVIVKLFCAALIFILSMAGCYNPGHLQMTDGYPYIAIITSFSQMWAMYCLVMFYRQFKKELLPIRPLAKFLCIKCVVFLTFWQGIVVAVFVKIHIIQETETYTTEQSSEGLQDFIICIEMFLATFAHMYAFPPKEFYDISNSDRHGDSSWRDYIFSLLWPYDIMTLPLDEQPFEEPLYVIEEPTSDGSIPSDPFPLVSTVDMPLRS